MPLDFPHGSGGHDAAFSTVAGAFAITSLYAAVGPSLQTLRTREVRDTTGRQHLMDTNILVGGVAVLVGFIASWAAHSFLPFLVLLGVYGFMAWWYWLILNSPNDHVERKD